MKYMFPNYTDGLSNLTNSILKYFDIKPFHNTILELDEILNEKNYKNVILILYDGMGSNILKRNLKSNSFLRTNKIKDIHAVFPPTTTASTTTILTGLNPNEHGWLGWDLYFKDIHETVTMFLNTKKDTEDKVSDESVAHKYYPYTSIIELINKKHKAYYVSPFSEYTYQNLEDMYQVISKLCNTGNKNFIYAYYHEPDHTMHELGTDAKEIKAILNEIDEGTKKLCASLDNTLVIVVADHGHLNSKAITLSDYKDVFETLKRDISIEGRACNFFIKEDEKENFKNLFNKYFAKDFILYTKEEVINTNIFGIGQNHFRFEDSLGDYLAIAISNKYFRYNENSVKYTSMHAGITEDEILVPLIVYKCNKENNEVS